MLDGRYETDLMDAAWELVKPIRPAARHGGRPRTTDVRAVVNAIFYLLRTGCQWRMCHTSSHHGAPFTTTFDVGNTLEPGCYCTVLFTSGRARRPAGDMPECSHHGWSIRQDHRARWQARIRWAQTRERAEAPHSGGYAGAAHGQSSRASQHLGPPRRGSSAGWLEPTVSRDRQRTFKIAGLTWIVELSFAWLGRNRRFSKDYEYRVQASETMLDIAATRLMLNRLAPAWDFSNILLV